MTASPPSSQTVARLHPHRTSIFTEMSGLATRHKAVNLGQGAPDFSGPTEVLEVAVEAIRTGQNQYPPGRGIRPLREAIAEHQQRWYGLAYDVDTEICVTAGATEALTAAIVGLCEAGDEVVTFAPMYDSYAAACAIAGAQLRTVVLNGMIGWRFDEAALRAAVTDRTRLLILNTPHNPSGHVFDDAELALIAELCQRHDVLVMTDEVYEHLWFDGARHRPIASIDGMRDRTLVVSSAGKTFSVTGWKVGWACGPAVLIDALYTAKQWMSFSNAAPMQPAIAHALRLPDAWFDGYRADYTRRREVLLGALAEHGFAARAPQGTYFATLDVMQLGADDGLALCRILPEEAGVAAIPVQAFYEPVDQHLGRRWIRLAFCKTDDAMREGVARLAAYRDR